MLRDGIIQPSSTMLQMLAELRPRAETRKADGKLERARHGLKKKLKDLEVHLQRIEQALCLEVSPLQQELTRQALVVQAKRLMTLAGKMDEAGPISADVEEISDSEIAA